MVQNLATRRIALARQSNANISSPLAGSLPVSDSTPHASFDVMYRRQRREARRALMDWIREELEYIEQLHQLEQTDESSVVVSEG
jgi:hypothetical protein